MCQFEYQRFQKCGHKGIEIIEYCNEVFWRAGMTGYLIPCPEQNFRAFFIRVGILDGLDFGTCLWVGLSGYCKLCEEEYGMPKAVPFRTYSDLKFLEGIGGLTSPILAVKLAEPIAYPNPPQSTKYSSTPNDGVTKEILDYEIAKSPSPLHEATPGIGENLLTRRLRTSLHHPYIFAPYIRNTVAGLISVEDQDTPNGLEDLYFPGKLQWYELDQGVDGTTLQWRSRGYHEGKMLEGPPSQYFHGHAGMTLADEQYVVNKLKDGVPLRIIWREKFKERGVDITVFYSYGRKTEQKFEARCVRANSRMEKIQKELAERSRAPDGIQPFGTYQQSPGNNLQPERKSFQPVLQSFGHSLDGRNQHLQHQQVQQQMQHQTQGEKQEQTKEQRQEQLMQQMIQQRLARQQVMKECQIMQQQAVLQRRMQQQVQQQMRQQTRQQMMQTQESTHNQKTPLLAMEEVEEVRDVLLR